LFFGGSIFVHELGHFLAARWRGMHVSRFSIGFGPKIFSWLGKDGVEYRLSWIPLGGYVALPQLADMSGIEGEADIDLAKLPPPSYTTKFIVSVAGAVFNVLFAFVLATVLWGIGQRVSQEEQTTRVGVVLPTIELPSGQTAPGPAFVAGIKEGDLIKTVDGTSVSSLSEIGYIIALGSGRGANSEPKVDITLERDGKLLHFVVFPQHLVSSSEKFRDIGLEPIQKVMLGDVLEDGAAAAAGLKHGDIITQIDGQPVQYTGFLPSYLRQTQGQPVRITFQRDNVTQTILVTPRKLIDPETKTTVYRLGVSLQGALETKLVHIPPWVQIKQHTLSSWRSRVSLLSPRSDIGLSKMSGPIGIVRIFYSAAEAGIRLVLWFTILINVYLAIFNLMPIPVLDGGHILFATIGKLRGRALPADFIATTQSIFIVLLISMAIYVSYFDVTRAVRENRADKPVPAATAKPAEPQPPAPAIPNPEPAR
jgi:regulator of sigma E protease